MEKFEIQIKNGLQSHSQCFCSMVCIVMDALVISDKILYFQEFLLKINYSSATG